MRFALSMCFGLTGALVVCAALTGCGCCQSVSRDDLAGVEESEPPTRPDAVVFNENEPNLAGQPAVKDEKSSEGEGFRFPDDHAGQLLAKVLPPSETRPVAERATEPRRHSGSPQVESPSLPLPKVNPGIPRVALANKRTPQPRMVMEEVFFVTHAEALLPAAVVMAAAERVRVPSVDVNKPIGLPILAKPTPDRAPVDDVTSEASNAAVQSGTTPARTKVAPFIKLTLPDPFENRRPVAPPVTPVEEMPNTTPKLPKP